MKFNQLITSKARARGFSLIELMISLTIGMVIVAAAFSAYLGANDASKIADAQTRMNEDAQVALYILSQQIRMAGTNPIQRNRNVAFNNKNPLYNPYVLGNGTATYTTSVTTIPPTVPAPSYTLSNFAIRGCDGAFSNITTAARIDTLTCVSNATAPDSIAISFEGDTFNTTPVGTSASDCMGNAVPTINVNYNLTTPATTATAQYWVVDNRFYIANLNNVPNLYCKGNGGTTQPLVENIEDLQVTYGVMSATTPAANFTTAQVAGYIPASDAALGNTAANWSRVITARICVVARSENPVLSNVNVASSAFTDCTGNLNSSFTDLRLRKAYSTTVVLRNRRS